MKRLISIWLCFVLVFSSAVVLIGVINNPVEGETIADNHIMYTTHAPIRIDSNADFTGANGVTGGNGTPTNPWIIENYEIDGTGYKSCIYIGNTTDYFVIRDCYIHDATNIEGFYTGTYLYNTQNGTIFKNRVSSNIFSIYLRYS